MGGSMTRHTLNGLCHVNYFTGLSVLFVHGFKLRTCVQSFINSHGELKRYGFGNGVGFGVADTESSCHIPHRLLCFHGPEGYNLGNSALTVLSGNIVDYLLTAFIAEVDIDIRHADSFRIEETFKNQIVPYRVDVGNFKTVSDD